MLTSLFLSFQINTAQAEESYYSHNAIAQHSKLYSESSKVSIPKNTEATAIMSKHNQILKEMEYSVATLNQDVLTQSYAENQKAILEYRLKTQTHIQNIVQAYDAAFVNAMNQAITDLAFENLSLCEGNAIQAMMGAGPSCSGTEVSMQIAAKMDQNSELKDALDGINELAWPQANLQITAQPVLPITGTEYYVDVYEFGSYLLNEQLIAHQKEYQANLNGIMLELETGDEQAIETAKKFREAYLTTLTADGEKLRIALESYALKNAPKDPRLSQIGFCGNVSELGGCQGTDLTKEMIQSLQDNKKWQKALKKSGL